MSRFFLNDPEAKRIAKLCDFVHVSGHDYLKPTTPADAYQILRSTKWHTKGTYDLAQWWTWFQVYSPLPMDDVWRYMGAALLVRVAPPIIVTQDWRYNRLFPHLVEAYLCRDKADIVVFSEWWHHLKPPVAPSKAGLKLYICEREQCISETCCSKHPELLDAVQRGSPPELLHKCMMFSQCFNDSHSVAIVTYTFDIFRSQLRQVMDAYVAQLLAFVPVSDLCRMIAHYAL